MTDNTNWVQCAVTYVDSGGSLFTNDVTVRCQFIRIGDKGDTGATGTGSGLEMTWETTTTDTDQGVGRCWGNSGTISSISVFYMDDVDANSISVNSLVDSWDDSTNRDIRGTIVVKKQTAPENYHIFNVTGQVTSASTYSKIAVDYVLTSGTISDGDAVFVEFARTGDQGTDAGLTMTFESTQTDTDQGAGKVFFNAAVASATIIYMDDLEQGGGSINDFVDSWDDSTSTVKGHVIMKKQDDLAVWALYSVSGSVTSASTYSKMTCAYIDGTGSFVDGNTVTVQFSRVGDKGTTGSTGAASSGFHYQFETNTADSDQGAGRVWLNHSTKSSASILYIDDDDNDGTDISAFIATWDDSSATSDKGFIKIQSRATPTDYAVFKISSSGTDNTAYWEFPVSHLVSAGTFSDTEVVDVFFTRSGDSGGVANRTVDTMTGDASDTTLALSQSPGSTNNCTCFIDGVGQHPGTDFNISGSTLTFTTAPPTGAIVVAICGGNESIGTPSDGTVTLAKMAVNSVDSPQYVDGSIDAVHLSANSVDSNSYVDGSIDLAHIATNQIDETLMKDAFVGDFTDATVTASDYFLHGDATASGNTKKDTIQGILDLAGGGSTTQIKEIYKNFDLSTATGTFAVTGVGFEPQFIYVQAAEHETLAYSWGFGTVGGPSKFCSVNWRKADADGIGGVTTEIAYYWPNGSHRHLIDIDSMDSDGATFGNLKLGSPTGTFRMYIFFLRFAAD